MTSPRIRTVLTVALLALAGCGDDTGSGRTETSSYEVTDAVSVVEARSAGGRIDIVVGSGTTVRVTETFRYRSQKPGRKQTVDGGELTLESLGCGGGNCRIDYRIELPGVLSVRLDSGGGQVVLGPLSGIVDVRCDGGSLKADALGTKEMTARTGGGVVDLRFTVAPDVVDVDSGGGDLTLRLPDGPYAVQAESDGGAKTVGVRTDPAARQKVHAESGGGRLTIGA